MQGPAVHSTEHEPMSSLEDRKVHIDNGPTERERARGDSWGGPGSLRGFCNSILHPPTQPNPTYDSWKKRVL